MVHNNNLKPTRLKCTYHGSVEVQELTLLSNGKDFINSYGC